MKFLLAILKIKEIAIL